MAKTDTSASSSSSKGSSQASSAPKQTVRSGAELRAMSTARAAVVSQARQNGTYTPGNTYDKQDSYAYLALGEQGYNQYAQNKRNSIEYSRAIDYLDSGQYNSKDTMKFLNMANQMAGEDGDMVKYNEKTNALDKTGKWGGSWLELANMFDGLYKENLWDENRNEYDKYEDEKNKLLEEQAKLKQNQANTAKSVTTGTQSGNFLGGYADTLKQIKANDTRIAELDGFMSVLNDDLLDKFGTDEEKAALQRLKENKYSKVEVYDWSKYAADNFNKDADQALVDDFMGRFNRPKAFYNTEDKILAAAESAGNTISSGLIGTASLVGKALDSNNASDINAETRGGSVTGAIKSRAEQEAQRHKMGLPDSPATDEYLAWYNSYDHNKDNFENLNAIKLRQLVQPELDNVNEEISAIEQRLANIDKSGRVPSEYMNGGIQEESELTARLKELKKQQTAYNDRLLDAKGQRDKTSIGYKIATDYQRDAFNHWDEVTDALDEKSQAALAQAKQNSTALGKMLLDMEKTGLEMGFDMTVGAFTGSSLVPMFIRVLGNESAAARRDGANLDQQIAYGLSKASIELATEKMFGAFDKIGYGKGIANEFSERIVAKLAETPLGRSVVRAMISMAEEGAEEGLSDLLAPIADLIYRKDKNFFELFQEETANFWYDVLLGAAMGGLGFAGGVVTGQNAQANTDLYLGEVMDTMKAQETKAEADKEAMNKALETGDEAKIQAVADQAGGVPQSEAYKVLAKIQQISQQMEKENFEVPPEGLLTKKEAAIAQSMGLLDKNAAKALQKATDKQQAKAKGIAENSKLNIGGVRDKIINNAIREGVKTVSSSIPEAQAEEQMEGEIPAGAEGPQSAKEFSSQRIAAAKEEKAAIKAGEMNNKKLADVVKGTDNFVSSGKTLISIKEDAFPKTGEAGELPLSKKVAGWLKKNFGDSVYSKKLKADVIVNERGIKNDISHGVGKPKAMTFQAVPAVLKNGTVVSKTTEEGKPKSIIIAGKVDLQGKPVNVYCLLKADDAGSNRFYLHEVSDGNGNLFYQLNEDGTLKENAETRKENAPSALQDSTPNTQGSAEEAPSEDIIPQETAEVQEKPESSGNAQEAPESASEPEGTPAPETEEKIVKPAAEAAEQSAEAEQTAEEEAPVESRAMPGGKHKTTQNALNEKTQVKPARNNAEERAKEVAEEYGVSDGTYLSYTRKQISETADRWIKKYGAENEYDRLVNSKDWNRVDFSEAGKLAYDLTNKLNRDMTNGLRGLGPALERKTGESYEEFKARQEESDKAEYQRRRAEIDALIKAYGEQKSVAGQKLQEQYKFSTADEIRIRASKRFLSYSQDGEVHNTDWSVNTKLWNVVDDLLTQMEEAETAGDTNRMIELTKKVSRIRSRENLLGKAGVNAENFMFKRMMKFGLEPDKLATLAYGNINKILDDITPISYADAIESVRMSNMLSNIATGINNLLNNAVSARTQAIAQNAAIPFAKAFEKVTGRKVAVGDSSLFRTKEIRRAEEVAYEYAVLSAYYGLNAEDGRLDVRGTGGTFGVMGDGVGGFVERALARYNFFVQALVLSPDAPVKARVETGIKKGIEKAFEGADLTNPEIAANKHELEGYASHEAKRRTLQDDNRFTNAVLYAKQHLLGSVKTPGEHKVIKGRELGSLDLGQFMIAFAKVPTNVGIQKAAATPYGSLYHVAKYAYTLAKAKADPSSVSTIEMAKAARDVGRATTTWGMIGLGALAAMTGALKNFDDTDDEEEKKLAAEKGYKGLMFNLSEIFRPGNEWRDGDLILSGNFLEILATPLAIGAIMYDASQEGITGLKAAKKGTMESFTGMVDAIMEIPGLQQVGDLYQSFANRDPNENDLVGALKAIGQFATSTSTSYLIPNIASQTVAGLDNKQRDVYGTNRYAETLRNIWMAKIPGLRGKLPEKTDALGNTRTYGENKFMSVINTVLLPGDIKRYHVSELEKELMRIKKETGYSGTFIDTKGPKKITVDDVDYMLDADQRRAFHQTKAQYTVESYDAFRNSDIYNDLTDEQKLAVYKSLRLDAERMTKNEALKAAGVDARVTTDKWEETLKTWDDKVTYLAVKNMFATAWDSEANEIADYAMMDDLVKNQYGKLNKDMQALLDNSMGQIDKIYDANKTAGITSENWQIAKNIYEYYTDVGEDGKRVFKSNIANEAQMYADIERETGANKKQMDWFEDNLKLWYQGTPDTDNYHELLNDAGLSRQTAANVLAGASKLEYTSGYKSVQAAQKYWNIVDTVPKSDQAGQWAAFWATVPSNASKANVKKMHNLQNQGYTLEDALKACPMGYVYTKTVDSRGRTHKTRIK